MNECLEHVFNAATGLVANSNHVCHAQIALLHREVDANVAAL